MTTAQLVQWTVHTAFMVVAFVTLRTIARDLKTIAAHVRAHLERNGK